MADTAPSTAQTTRGVVYTFYSFKGGVGRSMALANAACLLAKWGKRVLVLDWDLEAPGIEKFFQRWMTDSRRTTPGLVDIITGFSSGSPRDWHGCLLKVKLPDYPMEVHLISAGQDGPGNSAADYGRNLQQIKWDQLFDEKRNLGGYLERLRREWTAEYDFVLVDSRTGITDIGGICTIHLPDVLVCLFTTTEQSLQGVKDVMERAAALHASLPVERKKLMIVPLPARDESRTEYVLAKEWRMRFATELAPFYKDWAPKDEKAEALLDLLKIPYIAFWSFGERLPVLDEDVNNPDKLAYFYQLLARLMLGKLDLQEVRQGTLTSEAAETQKAEAAKAAEAAAALRLKAQQQAEAAARTTREEERAERQRRYEQYVKTRVDPAVEQLDRRGTFEQRLSIVGGALGIGGVVATAVFQYGGVLVLGASILAIVGAVLMIWQWRTIRSREYYLRGEQSFYETQIGRYSPQGADLFPLFVERVEQIIAGKVPVPEEASTSVSTGWMSTAPPQGETIALGRDIEAPPRAVFRKRALDPSAAPASVTSSARPSTTAREYDVYVSARREPFITAWLEEFIPLFRSWVSDLVGRDISIFVDEGPSQTPSESLADVLRAVGDRSTCLLAVVTPAHFQSRLTRAEWDMFAASRPDAIVPILLRGTLETLPEDVRRIQSVDFTDYAFVGEGFQKTQLYVEFQSQVRRVAERVAEILKTRQPATAVTSREM